MTPPYYNLSPAAENDLRDIIRYTNQKFGQNQVIKYSNQLEVCIIQLSTDSAYSRKLPEIHPDLKFIQCQNHYIFALEKSSDSLLVIAFFHQKMDIITRIKDRL